MNKENLLEDIEALEPMEQEKVARYVASLKKNGKINSKKTKNDVVLPMVGDDFNYPIEDYALKYETILELRELFADAPSAEELCAMLTK